MRASEEELVEVFRLAEVSGLGEIATHAGSVLANGWLRVSRFREVESLMSRALAVQVTPGLPHDFRTRVLGFSGCFLGVVVEVEDLLRGVVPQP